MPLKPKRKKPYKALIDRYKRSIEVVILGPYRRIDLLEALRDTLIERGFKKVFLAKDLDPREVIGEDIDALSEDEINRMMSEYVLKNSDFRVFVIASPPEINIGVYSELEIYVNSRYFDRYACIVLIESSLYDERRQTLRLGSSLPAGLLKIRDLPIEPYKDGGELERAVRGRLIKFIHAKISSQEVD